jgi:K+-transporting ATPase ATPase B chain
MKGNNNNLFQAELVNEALKQSFIKLNPAKMFCNPVMFMVWVGTLVMAEFVFGLQQEKLQGGLFTISS